MPESKDYSARALLITGILAIIFTVVALDLFGLLRHNLDKAGQPVGDFHAVYVKGPDGHRMSAKPSHLHAECVDNFLVIASDTDMNMKGLLVDYKNRGVHCQADTAAPAAGE